MRTTFTKGPCAVKTHGNVTELWSNDMQLGDTGIIKPKSVSGTQLVAKVSDDDEIYKMKT